MTVMFKILSESKRVPRRLLLHQPRFYLLPIQRRALILRQLSNASKSVIPSSRTTKTLKTTQPLTPEKNWLTRKVESSPRGKRIFLAVTKFLGYGSPKQMAARRAFVLYENICAMKPDQDGVFWHENCYLPPTFQSWFSVTNLHIWMLTVRLRALPPEHGKHYIQALIDHFFIDIEDRIRAVLQPPAQPSKPYTFESSFYINPNAAPAGVTLDGKPKRRSRAPDLMVTRQMKIFKEQWAGLGLSFDLALVQGDMEMAAAIWRNLLGARGAQGIEYPSSSSAPQKFRRSVNLVGGEVINVAKVDLEKEEVTDDGSGVHDFPPPEVDKYLTYPQVMLDVTEYVRRELARLDKVSDHDIIYGDWEKTQFGGVLQKQDLERRRGMGTKEI